jgi:predicted nucleic acid-binding protein
VLHRRSYAILGAIEVLGSRRRSTPFMAHAETALRKLASRLVPIAAHPLTLGHTIVTDNERGFSKVGELGVENWTS